MAVPHVAISASAEMPWLNFGQYSDYAAAIKLGARGFDTAFTYGDAEQRNLGTAIRESAISRSEFFVTTKILCCPTQFGSGHSYI